MTVHAARLRAQGLSGPPASSPGEVVERLLAVQAQDARGPFARAQGRAVAKWRYCAGRVELAPLEPVDDEVQQALDDDARAVERLLAG